MDTIHLVENYKYTGGEIPIGGLALRLIRINALTMFKPSRLAHSENPAQDELGSLLRLVLRLATGEIFILDDYVQSALRGPEILVPKNVLATRTAPDLVADILDALRLNSAALDWMSLKDDATGRIYGEKARATLRTLQERRHMAQTAARIVA